MTKKLNENYKILFVLPRSNGDILQSTAICKRIKDRYPNSTLYFGTQLEFVDLIEDCSWVDHIIEFRGEMDNPDLMNTLPNFDIVYTPHIYVQYSPASNWTHSGTGKNIIKHLAWHCDVDTSNFNRDEFFVSKDNDWCLNNIENDFPTGEKEYILFITGTGNEATTKHYKYWDEIVNNLVEHLPKNTCIVQGGLISDKKLKNEKVIDYRGKTKNIKQLNSLIASAETVVSVDSYAMHAAYILDVPNVALFGNTYSTCSGMNYMINDHYDNYKHHYLSSSVEHKKCYKNECLTNPKRNCINEIPSKVVFNKICELMEIDKKKTIYKVNYPSISGYTTIYNGIDADIPFIEAVESMMPYCDEIIILDGKSTDGTYEQLKDQYKTNKKVKIFQKLYDTDIPGIDGQQKAYARALCSKKFCFQFDADQIFEDGEKYKIKNLIRTFPDNADLMHLLTIDLFGTVDTIKKKEYFISQDYHMSRFSVSRNKDNITHGINIHARVVDTETGKVYGKNGQTDGCEFIDVSSGEMIPHFGPWNQELDYLRINDVEKYKETINQLYKDYPKFWHTSWASIERKISHFISFWDSQWQDLYNIPKENRKRRWFEGIDEKDITKEMIYEEAKKLFKQGGCHLGEDQTAELIKLDSNPPKILDNWFKAITAKHEKS